MSARVLIVDDDVDSCWLVALVLRRDLNLALAGEATDGWKRPAGAGHTGGYATDRNPSTTEPVADPANSAT
jgi:hypothetical protein